MYDYGIDEIADLVEVAMKYDVVHKAGAWFQLIGPETGEVICDDEGKEIKVQGQSNLLAYLKDNEVLLDELREQVNHLMGI
jgi:hypothetical protein